jgi:cytochrome P450
MFTSIDAAHPSGDGRVAHRRIQIRRYVSEDAHAGRGRGRGGSMTGPRDAIAAVTHPDPYPYYADLVARPALGRDDALGLRVAASAAAVTAVLTSPACRVRPPAEPVPPALVGSPAGTIFGHLVRMNDGARHRPLKEAVTSALAALAHDRVDAVSRPWAEALAGELTPHGSPRRLTEFASRLTACTVATLLGAPPALVPEAAGWTADLVDAFAAGSDAAQLERGTAAAASLLAMGREMMRAPAGPGLLPALARHGPGQDVEAVIANALGFLVQAHDATTGLIGNALVALARHPDVRRAVLADRGRLPAVLGEVLRHDAPVQNTRRFVAEDTEVAGATLRAGEAILVVLAAANRDPAANPDPARFDAARPAPRTFTFGAGPHACPGAALAIAVAAAGVETLLARGLRVERLAGGVRYRPAVNVRIPIFEEEAS